MGYKKVKENIYFYTDPNFYDVVAGAIELPTKLVMIDTGINLLEIKEFREWVEKTTGKKFEILFITHFHGDHSLGNQVFSDCRIISPKIHLEYMKMLKEHFTPENIEKEQSRLKDPRALEGLEITLPTETFEGQFEIQDGDVKVIIKHTGGHTSDSSYVYCPNYKVLFAGDNLFVNSYPYGGHSSCNPETWLEVYREFLTLDVETIVPGHGPVTDKSYIEKEITFMEDFKETLKELSSKGVAEEKILEECFQKFFPPQETDSDDDIPFRTSTVKRWYDHWVKGEE